MKNVFLNIIGLGICSLVFTGCGEELLSKSPTAVVSEASFYKTEADAVAAVYSVYAQLQNAQCYGHQAIMQANIWSDDCVKGGGGPADTPNLEEFNSYEILLSNGQVGSIWNANYVGVFRANKAIERIPEVDAETAVKNRLVAEAKFLRALYYYSLVIRFNGLPLVTSTATEDYTAIPRSSARETWEFIESDLLEAIAYLPDSYQGADVGRATKGSARGLLGRVYLFMQEWQKAADVYSDIIGSNIYRLMDDFGDNFLNKEGDNLPESLFEVQFATGTGSTAQAFQLHGWIRPRDVPGLAWGGNGFCPPTQSLADAFEPGDVRRKFTVMVEGDEVFGETYLSSWSPTGHNPRKYVYGAEVIHTEADANYKIIRYSDVLLGYAEAVFNGASGKASISGLEALNRVRRRAELADIPALTFNAIVQERRVELALEGMRFFDLVRWGIAKQVLGDLGFDENHDEYMPIPLSEILKNPDLEQNPGYY